ncbi:MAG: hypothetical protein OXR67_08085 [Chloroflexota bacterium]|nr:hypothetical protein [Chloroflexota bacterium]
MINTLRAILIGATVLLHVSNATLEVLNKMPKILELMGLFGLEPTNSHH